VREAPENIALTKNITTPIIIGTEGLEPATVEGHCAPRSPPSSPTPAT